MNPRMTRLQIFGLMIPGLLPLLWLLLGLVMLLGGAVLTLSYVITYLLLPILCLYLLWRIIRSRQRMFMKWTLTFLLLVLGFCLGQMLMMMGHFSLYDHYEGQKALETYEEDIGLKNDIMPEPADLGSPEKIEYHYFYNQIATFFDSDCYTLICAYSPGDYAAITEALDTRYTFHAEPLDAGEMALPPLYTLQDYEFRFLEMDKDTYRLSYPHVMILVGTNDSTHEIVWSLYSDDDLDYIPDPEEFLLDDCGWKFIR